MAGAKTILVDDEDKWFLETKQWRIMPNGYLASGRGELLHRVIMRAPSGKVVDHINGNKLDNRRANLRVVSQSVNLLNCRKRPDNSTGFTGVHYYKSRNKFTAYINYQGKRYNLGYFKTLKEAVIARQEKLGSFVNA